MIFRAFTGQIPRLEKRRIQLFFSRLTVVEMRRLVYNLTIPKGSGRPSQMVDNVHTTQKRENQTESSANVYLSV